MRAFSAGINSFRRQIQSHFGRARRCGAPWVPPLAFAHAVVPLAFTSAINSSP
jgi:hypothetical protein